MPKPLTYYLSLPYTIEIIPDDGAYVVEIKKLQGCMTQVDQWEDILPMITEAKELWLGLALDRGVIFLNPSR